LAVAVVSGLSAAYADTIFVDDDNCPGPGSGTPADPFCWIQDAIDAAGDTDEIVVAPGTYFETVNFLGKAITLRSSHGPEVTIIDAQGSDSAVTCDSGEGTDTILDGFTITGASVGGMYIDYSSPTVTQCTFEGNHHGGLRNDFGSPTVTGCTFSGNTGGGGGGIFDFGFTTVVIGCTFEGNNAENSGGGIFSFAASLVVTGCTFVGNTAGIEGGGIYNQVGELTLTDCTFIGNSAGGGGGMVGWGIGATLTDCTFSGNTATTLGGGLFYFGGNLALAGCTFAGNSSGLDGGGLFNLGAPQTVTDCRFEGNTADRFGGGMYELNVSLTMVDSTLIGNSAGTDGGGLYSLFSEDLMVTGCTFEGNAAGERGGGMLSSVDLDPAIVNCAFNGNSAAEGGGIFSDGMNATLTNCTFGGNAAALHGGAVFNRTLTGFPDDAVFANCILWGNSPDQIFEIYWGQDGSESPTTVSHSNVQGGWGGLGENNINANPAFVDPAGGDYRLGPGSPCIDAGNNTAAPEEITTDLDGNPRFVDDPDSDDCGQAPGACGDPPVVDMGAYEFQPCPWDLNGDGVVDRSDLHQVIRNRGPCDGCREDVNGDGVVNGRDVAAVAAHFGPCP
jgi:predicted outer membrane repeat protein